MFKHKMYAEVDKQTNEQTTTIPTTVGEELFYKYFFGSVGTSTAIFGFTFMRL